MCAWYNNFKLVCVMCFLFIRYKIWATHCNMNERKCVLRKSWENAVDILFLLSSCKFAMLQMLKTSLVLETSLRCCIFLKGFGMSVVLLRIGSVTSTFSSCTVPSHN